MLNFSEYIYTCIGATVLHLVSVVWHVCSYYPHKSPVLRNPAAQTAEGDPTVRAPGFSMKCYFRLAGCDPEGSKWIDLVRVGTGGGLL
jgi:hypothetical protein